MTGINPAEHLGLIGRVLARGSYYPIEYEEAMGIGMLALVKAVASYDPSRGAWSSWAILRINGDLVDEQRRLCGRSRPNPQVHSLDVLQELDSEFDIPTECILPSRSTIDHLIGALNPRRQDVMRMTYVDELSVAAIARKLGVSESRVSKLKLKALRQLRLARTSGSPLHC